MRRRARAAIGCLVAMALGGAGAVAEPTRLVTAPSGWRADPEQASALAQRFAATSHFGGLSAVTAVEAYVAPQPGAALVATRATAELPGDAGQAARATRAALDGLRESSRRVSLTGGSAQEQSWQERVETAPRQIAATLAWRDPASQAAEAARIVIASDGKRIAAVTGECVSSDGADVASVAACVRALASLDPGIAAAQRVELALGPPVPEGAVAPPARAPATMSAGAGEPAWSDERPRMPPMAIPQEARGDDHRTAYVGGGLVVLAAMFWWNRRRRDRFEREDGGARVRPAVRDDDADELHAAARGDVPDVPDRPDRAEGRDRRDPP